MAIPRARLLVVGLTVWVFALLAFRAFYSEPNSLVVIRRTIQFQPWHSEHSGMKVALISDLHIGSPYVDLDKLKTVVSMANAEEPDLLLLLGDYVATGMIGGRSVAPQAIAKQLKELRAPLGVVAVLGNHDSTYGALVIRRVFEAQKITVLENENLRIDANGKSFWLCGLADLLTRGDSLLPTLANVQSDDPIIVMMHNPDVFPHIPLRVSLTVAGHTHGGQVKLPIFGRPVVPSRFGQRYAYGLIQENGKQMYVTSGVGTSLIPVRFGVPPEITILTLDR